jgi:Protein of unknwon function (DUF3310)
MITRVRETKAGEKFWLNGLKLDTETDGELLSRNGVIYWKATTEKDDIAAIKAKHKDDPGPKGELGENGQDFSLSWHGDLLKPITIESLKNIKSGNILDKFDPVQKPEYYNKGKIECIDAIEVATDDLKGIEAACTANAIKYLWRWKAKENPVQDLKKAIWYIEHLIKKIENED